MKHYIHAVSFISLVTFAVLLSMVSAVNAQEREAFPKAAVEAAKRAEQTGAKGQMADLAPALSGCKGPITEVVDVAFEGLKFTSAVYGTSPGGGEGRQFDKTPVLSASVNLEKAGCLDAHVSAIVGSRQAYGVSNLALFQVTLTPKTGGPRAIIGHYRTPYGLASPAVALEAERDVDMYASNFFQRVGFGRQDVPPGVYRVDVWWAGGPNPGGAIGAGFVLKLYLR